MAVVVLTGWSCLSVDRIERYEQPLYRSVVTMVLRRLLSCLLLTVLCLAACISLQLCRGRWKATGGAGRQETGKRHGETADRRRRRPVADLRASGRTTAQCISDQMIEAMGRPGISFCVSHFRYNGRAKWPRIHVSDMTQKAETAFAWRRSWLLKEGGISSAMETISGFIGRKDAANCRARKQDSRNLA